MIALIASLNAIISTNCVKNRRFDLCLISSYMKISMCSSGMYFGVTELLNIDMMVNSFHSFSHISDVFEYDFYFSKSTCNTFAYFN